VTGHVGLVPAFDPLEVMLEETHKRGIQFHGWLNPMRIQSGDDIRYVSEDYLIGQWYRDEDKRGRYIAEHRGNWFLNPAHDAVLELIAAGAEEITSRYNVDGLHIDDYFYPTVNPDFDTEAFRSSAFRCQDEFRIFTINRMVRGLYTATKRGNPDALFGISPSGCIDSNYEKLFADVKTWATNTGFADYIVPQIYFGFEHETHPFIEVLDRWQNLMQNSPVSLIIGLAAYKVGREDMFAGTGSREWLTENSILQRQIEEVQNRPSYGGVVFFSYNFLTAINN
jgi:uncharacterized lipoprotein YddW (UPF0748 family)